MQLIELDALDTERLPARPAGVGQVARAAVRNPQPARTCHAALGRHDDGPAVAGPRAQRLGDQPLVVPHLRRVAGVRVGGVEQTDSSIERGMDHRDGSPVVAIGRGREAHAAHPDARQTGDLTRHVGRHRTEGAVRQSRHNRRMLVTSRLHPGYMLAWPLDRKLTLWLVLARGAGRLQRRAVDLDGAVRVAALTLRRDPAPAVRRVCCGVRIPLAGSRASTSRRVCLWDTWLSGIMLGRSAATIAELCFALQCSLLLVASHRHLDRADITGDWPLSRGMRRSCGVPLPAARRPASPQLRLLSYAEGLALRSPHRPSSRRRPESLLGVGAS